MIITRIDPSSDLQLFPITFICRVDRVAQEINENFNLTIEFNSVFLGMTSAPIIRNTLTGTIQDSNGEYILTSLRPKIMGLLWVLCSHAV